MKGLVTAYFAKIRKGNAIAWAVLVSLVTVLGAAFSGMLGFPLPASIQHYVDISSPVVMPILLFLQTCIVAAKDEVLGEISVLPTESTRSLMGGDEAAIPPQSLAEKALGW